MRRLAFIIGLGLLAIEALALAGLAAQLFPTGPAPFQRDVFYSAFLSGDEGTHPLVGAVRWGFFLLAVGVLLPALGGTALGLWRWRRLLQAATKGEERTPSPGAARFDLHQRTQHILLLSSITVLALTGLPQGFPDWPTSQWWLALWGSALSARTMHRVAATALDFAILYHLVYLAGRAFVEGHLATTMLPTRQDLRELWHTLRFLLGREGRGPAFGRFSYRQKLDYWVVAVCAPALSITGLGMVHADLVPQVLSPLALALSVAVHRSLAAFFLGYLVVVHLHHVHLAPEVFPFNPSMFTGSLPTGARSGGTVLAARPLAARAPQVERG